MTSFIAIRGVNDKMELQFVLDGQRAPVKLGDGAFGCVFHVRDSANNNYALKIFYESCDKFVQVSQNEEINLGNKLRKHFKDRNDRIAEVHRYLVVSLARVECFKSSKAYKCLGKYFEKLAFKVSDKATVMDIYPQSLKDLLERGWTIPMPPEKTKRSAATKADAEKLTGYSILRDIPQTERERCILPLVRQVAEALSILSDAKYNHQDIKPANILLRGVGQEIEVALADLGFVNTGESQKHGSLFRHQPLGTRHYRSPEQTDFFDICEVDLRCLVDGDYELSTRDPKFRDTFSEEGDFVVFSKLPDPIQWEINKAIAFETIEGEGNLAKIRIKGLLAPKLHHDVKTQITINKRQTDRTDIFGLGAIMFDMLTCGQSPEQFYDLLRVHDRKEEIDKGLAQRYLHFRNGGGTVPEIDAIFQNMRVDANSEFPHPDMVRIILKCMMSKPSDSYWNSGRWETIKCDLDELINQLKCFEYKELEYNHLTKSNRQKILNGQQHTAPEECLREIQECSYMKPDQCVKRLVLGIRYLRKVVELVGTEIKGGPDVSYLANISPGSLIIKRNVFVPRLVFFEEERDFKAVIESGNPRALVQLFSAGALSPPFIDGLVQEGEVWVSDDSESEGADSDVVRLGYELWGSDGGWPSEKMEGYRLILDLSTADRVNREITQSDRSKGVLCVSGDENLATRLSVNAGRYRAHFVRRFDRSHYYISMLGVYIRLIFFADTPRGQMHTPQSVYFFKEGRSLNRSRLVKLRSFPNRLVGRNKSLDDLFLLISGVYVRFLTLECGDKMEKFVKDIENAISAVLQFPKEKIMNESVDEVISNCRSLCADKFPDIDELVNKNIVAH